MESTFRIWMCEASLWPFWGRIIWIFSLQQQSKLSLLALFNNIGSFTIIVKETHVHVLLIWSHNVCTMCSLLMGSVVIQCFVFFFKNTRHFNWSKEFTFTIECTRVHTFCIYFCKCCTGSCVLNKKIKSYEPLYPKLDGEDWKKIDCSSEMTRDSSDKLNLHYSYRNIDKDWLKFYQITTTSRFVFNDQVNIV